MRVSVRQRNRMAPAKADADPDFVRDSLPTRDRRTAQLEEVRVHKGRPERSGVHAEAAIGGTEGLRQERPFPK